MLTAETGIYLDTPIPSASGFLRRKSLPRMGSQQTRKDLKHAGVEREGFSSAAVRRAEAGWTPLYPVRPRLTDHMFARLHCPRVLAGCYPLHGDYLQENDNENSAAQLVEDTYKLSARSWPFHLALVSSPYIYPCEVPILARYSCCRKCLALTRQS
jgi:hypothetical protein